MADPTHLIDADQLSKEADLQAEAKNDLTRPHQPDAQPQQDNPAPDLGSGVSDPGASPSGGALGGATTAPGAPAAPKQPGIGEKINSFITGGQQSPGQMWRGVIAGALEGLGPGAATGHLGAGAGAGAEAQQKAAAFQAQQKQQAVENQRNQSKDEIESQFKRAQIATMNHDIFTTGQELKLKQLEASDKHAELGNTMQREIMAAPGAKDLGIVQDADDLVKLHQSNPDLPKDLARGNIMSMPNYETVRDKDGNPTGEVRYNGTHAYYVPPDYLKQMTDHDVEVPIFTPGKNRGEPGHFEFQTIPAGKVTNQEKLALLQSQGKESAKYDNDTAVARASEFAARAQMELAKGATNKQAADQMAVAVKGNAQDLVEGDMNPSQLNRRSKDYNSTIAEARAYSMAKYGKPFDIAKADADYKYATNKSTQDTLKYLNSLTGADNKGGNLADLVQQSNAITRTQFPGLNDTAAWARLEAGDPAMAAYHTTVTEVADQVAKILQGSGGTSDAKMKQANELFRTGYNKQQVQAVASDLRGLLANRKTEMIGDNRYLKKWAAANLGGGAPAPGGAQGGGGTTSDPFDRFGGKAH